MSEERLVTLIVARTGVAFIYTSTDPRQPVAFATESEARRAMAMLVGHGWQEVLPVAFGQRVHDRQEAWHVAWRKEEA